MKIRKAQKKDIEQILVLSSELLDFHYNFDKYYKVYEKYEDHREYYLGQLKKKGTLYLVAENEKKEIVAFASGYIISMGKSKAPKIGVLVANFVRKDSRKKGIGSALFTSLLDWFKKNNIKYIEMSVDSKNKKALNLWRKNGFKDYQVKLKKDL